MLLFPKPNFYSFPSLRTNKDNLGSLVVTLDSHHKEHIAHGNFWKDGIGNEPTPFTRIFHSEIGSKWFPTDPSLLPHALEYSRELENKGRFTLIVWPDHCIIGSKGQAIGTEMNLLLEMNWTNSLAKSGSSAEGDR
jgi:hypothetical protein